MTHNENWAACAASVDPGLMEAAFAGLAADLAPVYRRRDARADGLLYVRGLLMPQVAGNCWSIGEAVGLSRPYRLHHLLERAARDEDAARDAVRAFLARHLGADGGASKYSKKERPDFRGLIELVRENKVDAIFATEVERLVRQPAQAEQLIDLASPTNLREVHLTSEESCNLSTRNGVYRLRQAVNLAERESRKTSERLRRKLAYRARNGQTHGGRRCFGYKAGNMEIDEAEASILRKWGTSCLPAVVQRDCLLGQFAAGRKARKYPLTGRVYCGKCGFSLNGETKRDHPGRPLRPVYHCRVQGDTRREHGCGGMTINADALNWYVRESIFDHLGPEKVVELLRDNEPGSDKLKRLLDQRAAQQLRLDSLVDDYAAGLLDRAELSRAKARAQTELSRINGEIELLGARKRRTGQLSVRESLRQTWEASEGIAWRGALLDMVVERIDVFPGIGKPFVNVDGVIMRFDKGRVAITWRKGESAAPSVA